MKIKKLLFLLIPAATLTAIILPVYSCSKKDNVDYTSTIEQGSDCLDFICETEETITVERNITNFLPVNKPISEIIPGDSIYYIQTDRGPLQIEKNKEYTFCIDYNIDPRYKIFFQKSFDYFKELDVWKKSNVNFKEVYEKDENCCEFSLSLADISNTNILGRNSFSANKDRKVERSDIVVNKLYYDRLIYNKSAKVREIGTLSLLQTIVHELGHTIGLRDLDIQAGIGSNSLMSYSYSMNDWKFTDLDYKNIEMLYLN